LIRSGFLQRYTDFGTKHFSDNYTKYSLQSLTKAEELELRKGHNAISRICDSSGVDVYNATRGGELEVYPRVDLQQTLRS